MLIGWDSYLERLGPQGLRLVLACLLEESQLESLTGIPPFRESPGAQAQSAAELATEDPGLASRLLEAMDEATAGEGQPPESWPESRLREAIAEMLREPGPGAAAVLHRLARSHPTPLPPAEIRAAAELIAPEVLKENLGSRPKWVAKVASGRAEVRELEQERRELESRVRRLETQLERALERSATLDQRLAKRLEEIRSLRSEAKSSREERGRLEREVARLRKRLEDLIQRRARERTGEITAALRRLTTEQRRAGSAMDKLRQADADRRGVVRDQTRKIDQLAQLVERVASVEEAQARVVARAQEEILRQLAELRIKVGDNSQNADPTGKKSHGKGDAELPRVGVFVDVQNMFYGAREKGARLDFSALLEVAGNGRRLVRAVAYVVESKEIDQSSFIHLLQMKAYEVKRKPLKIRPDRSMKGNWDLEMAVDALATAEHLDVVVLVTGDGDFVPLVRQLKLHGLRVEVYGFRPSSAPDLREAADRFVPITKRLLRPLPAARQSRRPAKQPRKER